MVPADGYGFSVGASQIWMSAEDADRELDAAALTNARWMRVHIDWHAIENGAGASSTGVTSIAGSTARAPAGCGCSA